MTHQPEENVTFTFEGKTVTARPGQSIAAALHAEGVTNLSRGVKYHTPRGYTCGFGACGDCPLKINGMPNTPSCTTPAMGGEVVSREQGFPHPAFDVLRTADLMRPLLGAGFQFSLFARQPRLSKLAGWFLAILAGGNRFPTAAAVAGSRVASIERHEAEVLVIGGGLSGLTAAIAAAELGRSVVVVDRSFTGGRSPVRTEPVTDGEREIAPAQEATSLHDEAQRHPKITLITGVAAGVLDGVVPVMSGVTRHEIRSGCVVLASGSYEVGIAVPGSDRPGVMLADAALKLARVERVSPGQRAVVIADDARAEAVADALSAEGVNVAAVIGADQLERVTGWGAARAVVYTDAGGKRRRVRCDLVCVAAGRRPADELVLHLAYAEAGSPERIAAGHTMPPPASIVVGSAAGSAAYDLAQIRAAVSETLQATNSSPQ